jgi:alpha-ribazole phosphatase
MVGWTDLPADLSDQSTLDWLDASLPLAPVVSSDLSRAVMTADALCRGRPRLPHDRGLREFNFGQWEMRAHAEIEAEDPVTIRAFWDSPGSIAPPGGESWDAVQARVSDAIDRHIALGLPDLIVVCHFGPILTQLQRALGKTAIEILSHRIDNFSITGIHRQGERWSVWQINHLP